LGEEKLSKIFFLAPVVVLILVITVFPLLYTIGLSLFKWTFGSTPPTFIGINNFLEIFEDARFWGSVKITGLFIITTLIIEFIIGLGLAIFLETNGKGVRLIKPLCIIPLFASPVAMAFIFIVIFNEQYGPVNYFLSLLGIGPIRWLSTTMGAFSAMVLIDIWQWTPFIFIILLSGLQSLSREPIEAAAIDGASRFQSLIYVIFPMLRPIIVFTFLLKLIESFKVFDIANTLTGGGPGVSTEVYSLYTYRIIMKYFQMGKGSALAVIMLVVVILIGSNFLKILRGIWVEQ